MRYRAFSRSGPMMRPLNVIISAFDSVATTQKTTPIVSSGRCLDLSALPAIVAMTHAGTTARQLAALRPAMPVYAVTDAEETARLLMLCWGVTPHTVDAESVGEARAPSSLTRTGALPPGATVVLVRIHHELTRHDANFVSLWRLDAAR